MAQSIQNKVLGNTPFPGNTPLPVHCVTQHIAAQLSYVFVSLKPDCDVGHSALFCIILDVYMPLQHMLLFLLLLQLLQPKMSKINAFNDSLISLSQDWPL